MERGQWLVLGRLIMHPVCVLMFLLLLNEIKRGGFVNDTVL